MKVGLQLISQLDNFASRLSSINNISALINTIKDILEEIVEVDYSGLYLFDQELGSLRLYYAKGFTEEERLEAEKTAHDRHPGLVYRTKKKIHIPDVSKDSSQSSSSSKRSFEINSRLYLPVMSLSEAVGAFGLASSKKNCFTEEHIAVLSFVCNLAGVVYSNINYLEKNKKAVIKERNLGKEIIKKNKELKETYTELEEKHNKLVGILSELEESNDKFRMLSESTFEAIFFSEKGICTNQNATAEKLFGYTLDEAVGKNAIDWIHPEHHKKVIDNIKSGYDKPYEAVALRKDGSTFPCEIQGSMNLFKGNTFRVTALRDITERINAKAAQKESEEKYKSISQSTIDIIFIVEKNGKVRFVNDSIEKMLGWTPKEVIGKSFIKLVPVKSIPKYLRSLSDIFLHGELNNFIAQIYHKNGQAVDLEINGKLIKQDGVLMALGSARDISYRKRAEKEIEENHKKLEQYAERLELALIGSDAGLWDWNIETGDVYFNDRWCNMLGYEISEVEPNVSSWENMVHPEDMQMVTRVLTDHLEGKTPLYQTEHRVRTKSGGWKWILDTGRVTKRANSGKALRAVGTHIDITRQKENEEKLRDNEKYLKTINQFATSVLRQHSIDEIIWELINLVIKDLGLEDCVIYLLDEDKKNLIQRAAYGPKQSKENKVKDPIIIPYGKGIVGTVAKTGIPEVISDVSKDPRYIVDDRYRYSELTVPIITDGEVIGIIDTEHHEKNFFNHEHLERLETISGLVSSRMKNAINQEKLLSAQVSLKKLSTAVEQSPLSIVITDVDGIIEFVNPTFTEISGYSATESIGTKTEIFKPGTYPKSIYVEMWETINKGEKWVGELINKKKNGESLWVLTSISPIKDSQDQITNFVAIQADITVNKKLENDLIKAKEYAEEANKAKSEFLANMSHEIRTPMNAVYGLIRLMEDTHLTGDQENMINKIRLSSDNLLNIINDILDFSKIESGQVKLDKSVFNIEEVIRRILDSMEYQASGKNLSLEYQFDDNIDRMLYGDSVRLHQIMLNLINNAIKFTEQGKVIVSCKLIKKTDNLNKIKFEVKDTGIGIKKENINKIFKIFEQEDESTTRRYGGTGLGLAISNELVELMGGKINIVSEKNKGSRFYFNLDMEVSEDEITTSKPNIPQINHSALKDKTILVVEDNKYNQYIAETILRKWSADVVCANHGKQALEIIDEQSFDLILMDKQMPVLDGIETTKQIRNNLILDVPIIALTANVVKGVIDECLAAGMNEYISKPFEPEELYVKILNLLNLKIDYEEHSDHEITAELPEDKSSTQYDISKLDRILGGNKMQLKKMIAKFLDVTPDYVDELNKCLNENDIEGIEKTAHKIKASIDLIASNNLKSNIRLIHDYSKNKERLDKLPQLINYFIENYSKLLSQLKTLFK